MSRSFPPNRNTTLSKQGWTLTVVCFVFLAQLLLCSSISARHRVASSEDSGELGAIFDYAVKTFKESPRHAHEDNGSFKGKIEEWLPEGHFTWADALDLKRRSPQKFDYFARLAEKHRLKSNGVLENPKTANIHRLSSGAGENHQEYWHTAIPDQRKESVVVDFAIPQEVHDAFNSHLTFWARSDSKRKITITMAPVADPTKSVWSVVAELNSKFTFFAGICPAEKFKPGSYELRFDLGKEAGSVDLRDDIAVSFYSEKEIKELLQTTRLPKIDRLIKNYKDWRETKDNLLYTTMNIEIKPPTAVTAQKFENEHLMYQGKDAFREGKVSGMSFNLGQDKSPVDDIQLSILFPRKLPRKTPLKLFFELLSPKISEMNISLEEDGKTNWQTKERIVPDTWEPYGYSIETGGEKNSKRIIKFKIKRIAFPLKIASLSLFIDKGSTVDRNDTSASEVVKRIDSIRRGGISICVKDKLGNPIKNAEVKIEQQNQEFHFGCRSTGLNPSDQTPSQKRFQKQLCNLFNFATAPAYWDELEAVQGKPDYASLDAKARWCAEHHIYFMATDLTSLDHIPSWVSYNPVEIGPQIKKHVIDTIVHFGAQIPAWEVAHNLTQMSGDKNANSRFFGWLSTLPITGNRSVYALENLLNWAHRAEPKSALDFYYREDNLELASVIISGKRKFGYMPKAVEIELEPETLSREDTTSAWRMCNAVAYNSNPILISIADVAINSGAKQGFPSKQKKDSKDLEEIQAKQAENLYSLFYSHPEVTSIIWRNLKDDPLRPKHGSGLVRSDGTTKPAYDRLLTLIRKKWWTNEQGKTDEKGIFSRKIYYGDHLLTVSDDKGHSIKQEIHFPKRDGRDVTIQITL
jgi:hypothetical protein